MRTSRWWGVLVLGALVLFMVGSGARREPVAEVTVVTTPSEEPTVVVSDPVRLAAFGRTLKAARRVADRSRNSTALALVGWAEREAVPVQPGVEQGQPVAYWLAQPRRRQEEALTLMPLFTSDQKLGEPWASMLGPQSRSFYGTADGLQVAMWMDKLTSESILGIATLHELLHAEQFQRAPFDSSMETEEEWRAREREAYLLQNRLLAAMGGVSYERVMERLVTQQLQVARRETDGWYWQMIGWEEELAQIFSPTTTPAAQQALRTMVFHDLVFRCLVKMEPDPTKRLQGELAAMQLTY